MSVSHTPFGIIKIEWETRKQDIKLTYDVCDVPQFSTRKRDPDEEPRKTGKHNFDQGTLEDSSLQPQTE